MKLKLSNKRYVKKEITVIKDAVTLGLTAPTHRDILEVKAKDGPFLKALSEFRDEYIKFKEDYDALDAQGEDADPTEQMRLIERYNQITFKDLETLAPIYEFISAYIVTIKGVEVEDDEGVRDVEKWEDIPDDFKMQILEEMTLPEIQEVYQGIVSLSSLDPNV